MTILISACLLGENCKYNGKNNFNQELADFISKNKCKVVPVCPEVLGGLPTPRIPSEIVKGTVINREGINVDTEFRLGAQKALQKALAEKVCFAILKAKSPSCGRDKIYDGTFTGTLTNGDGIFASELKKSGIKIYTEEEIADINPSDF